MEKNGKMNRSGSTDSLPRSPSALAPPLAPASPGKSLTSWRDYERSDELTSLNRNLSQYIGLVQKLESGHQGGVQTAGRTTINVNIDRSQVGVITEKYSKGLTDLQKLCTENDKTIAGLLAEIFRLESRIKLLNQSNSDKLAVLGDLDLTLGQLEAEVARLKASLAFHHGQKTIFEKRAKAFEVEIAELSSRLDSAIGELTGKRQENAGLSSEIYRLEKELRFRISVLGRELVGERTKSSIDWEEIRSRKGERYSIWMEEELEKLQGTYQQQMADVQTTLEDMYQEKERSLQASLDSAQKEAAKPNLESNTLKVELETLKLKVGELEANSQQLKVKKLEISTEVEMRREAHRTQMSAKERELARLRAEHDVMKMKYEEMLKGINKEQVALYSSTLTPEIRRISARFGSQQMESSRKTINFSRNTVTATVTSKETVTNGNGVKQ